MNTYGETASTATLPLIERIKSLLNDYNKVNAEADEEYRSETPDMPDTPVFTVADVVKAVSASDIRGGFGLDGSNMMESIADEIMREIAGVEYDPWPELTKEELRFLIGDRKNSPQCPYGLYSAAWYGEGKLLTFAERVLADRNRVWLEKGKDAKRKRLEKAQAEVIKLSGKAA